MANQVFWWDGGRRRPVSIFKKKKKIAAVQNAQKNKLSFESSLCIIILMFTVMLEMRL